MSISFTEFCNLSKFKLSPFTLPKLSSLEQLFISPLYNPQAADICSMHFPNLAVLAVDFRTISSETASVIPQPTRQPDLPQFSSFPALYTEIQMPNISLPNLPAYHEFIYSSEDPKARYRIPQCKFMHLTHAPNGYKHKIRSPARVPGRRFHAATRLRTNNTA